MISLVVPVMNRSDRIIPCLKTWINIPEITEIIIVDWSSTIPIKNDPTLQAITNNPKIKIIRVQNEQYFMSMSFSLNVGINHSTKPNIIKCDIDYQLIDKSLINYLITQKTEQNFLCGMYKYSTHFHGFAYFSKHQSNTINGYNEIIKGWGWDDEDFYRRLEKANYNRIEIQNIQDYIFHIPHDDNLRTINYPPDQQNRTDTIIKNMKNTKDALLSTSNYETLFEDSHYKIIKRLT
jgi:hypothetical protein